VTDERLLPGSKLAEQHCIACHLTATSAAAPFHKMVQLRNVNAAGLTGTLRGGHAMSPITPDEQPGALAHYVTSLH
jgi:hypothetical protein